MRQKTFLETFSFAIFLTGGGILGLNAVELNQICTPTSTTCTIRTSYSDITNNSNLPRMGVGIGGSPNDRVQIGSFNNYGSLNFVSIDEHYNSIQNFYN